MEAILFDNYGGIEVMYLKKDAPKPVLTKPGDILIRVKAAALNPVDFKIRHGAMKALKKIPFPSGLGKDAAGIVEAVGADVKDFKVGDKVAVDGPGSPGGSLAQYCIVPARLCAKIPDSVEDYARYAAVPLAGQTALQALRRLQVKSGDSILICGGAGGVGTFAIQLAKVMGASVIATTASESKFDVVRKLGATHCINYKDLVPSLEKYGEKFDHIFDCSGDALVVAPFLKPTSKLMISIAANPEPESFVRANFPPLPFFVRWYFAWKVRGLMSASNNRYEYMWTQANTADTATLIEYMEAGKIEPLMDLIVDGLDKTKEAYTRLESGRATGKVVVRVL